MISKLESELKDKEYEINNLKEKEQVFQNQSDELRSIISNCNETVKLQTSNFKNLTVQKI